MSARLVRRVLGLAGVRVPLIEVTGARDGPALTVIAGVHGCEYAPMAAVRLWAAGLAGRELRGTVRAVPVLNLPSFWARSPFVVPGDGKNLNRCFPGDPAGTLAERLAHAAFTELITGADAVIDAHAGDLPETLEPFALYDAGPAEARALELAEAYGLGYVIRQQPGPDRAVAGATSTAAAGLGIPAIIAEAGGCGIIDEHAVALHLRGLDRVLAALGMAEDPAPDRGMPPPVRLSQFTWLRSAADGWWQPSVRPGEMVVQGQLLGTVSTIDGARTVQSVTAPADGVPMFITTSPAVETGGLLLGLGAGPVRPASPSSHA